MVLESMNRDHFRGAAAWSFAGAATAFGASTVFAQWLFERHFWTIYAIGHREGALQAVRAVGEELGRFEVVPPLIWAMGAVAIALGLGALMLRRDQRAIRWPALAGITLALWALWRQFQLDETFRWM